MNILVIDDDASLRRTVRMSLELLGHHATEARDSTRPWSCWAAGRSMRPCSTFAWPRNRDWTCCPAAEVCAGTARRRGDGLRHHRDGR